MAKLKPTKEMFLGVIDHTFLKTEKEGFSHEQQKIEIKKLVGEASLYDVFSVCVRESMVSYAKELIKKSDSQVKVVSVVGFPFGDDFTLSEKIGLLEQARKDGADEFDMVISYQAFKKGDEKKIYEEILRMSEASGHQVLKVIFENCYLSEKEKESSYQIAVDAFKESRMPLDRRFLKTSTGFAKPSPGVSVGATLSDIKLMAKYAKGAIGIKPAGGVKDYEAAINFFEAVGSPWLIKGETLNPYLFRIGTSSLVSELVSKGQQEGSKNNSNY